MRWIIGKAREFQKTSASASVQFSCSVVSNSLRPLGLHAVHQASLSITKSWSLLKLMSIKLVMPSNHLILCRPLLLPPSIFPSIRIFSNESVLRIRWPKYWTPLRDHVKKNTGEALFHTRGQGPPWHSFQNTGNISRSVPQSRSIASQKNNQDVSIRGLTGKVPDAWKD